LESILGLLKSLKIRALSTVPEGRHVGQKHEDYDDETEELVGDIRMSLVDTHSIPSQSFNQTTLRKGGGEVFFRNW
jgi:hypothetical protein